MVVCCAVIAGWVSWREDGVREQQACGEGGEAGRIDRRWEGCGTLDARYLGGDEVVRALEGDAPLSVDFCYAQKRETISWNLSHSLNPSIISIEQHSLTRCARFGRGNKIPLWTPYPGGAVLVVSSVILFLLCNSCPVRTFLPSITGCARHADLLIKTWPGCHHLEVKIVD